MLYQSFLGTDEMKKKYLLLIAISIFSLAACADKTDADTQTAVSYNRCGYAGCYGNIYDE